MDDAIVGNTAVAGDKKSTLMDIVARFREVMLAVDVLDGEVTDHLYAELEAAEGDLVTKIDRCLWVGDEAASRAKFMRERAKSLSEQARILEAQQDRLREYVKVAMERARVQKLETPNYASVLIKKNPASVDIEELAVFIERHKDDADLVTWEPKVNKKAIGDRLKAGKVVEGAKLITDKTCLQVK
jgi:Holliday junction resolvase